MMGANTTFSDGPCIAEKEIRIFGKKQNQI